MTAHRKPFGAGLRSGIGALAATLALAAALAPRHAAPPANPPALVPGELSLIVQARDTGRAAAVARESGGRITHELGIIHAVAATVTTDEAQAIARRCPECRLYPDRATRLMGTWSAPSIPDADFPTLIGAALLHATGIQGQGATVAIVDSGFLPVNAYVKDGNNSNRVLAQYDAFTDKVSGKKLASDDEYGHGTHVTGIVLSSDKSSFGFYQGIAPGASLVSVKAFDGDGGSTYATVIRAIGWVVENKDRYNIRVLNASFGAPVGSWYWDDPINQAVMRAWKAGIVVVASAGNTGPNAMTIQVPGNLPYVITVGAMTDNYTPAEGSDDYLASFSAAGPTYEAHVKPDLVAPGGHNLSRVEKADKLGVLFPQYFVTSEYYRLSGTSQAAAVVSGVAALMLSKNPSLTPDEVKCHLVASARPAVDPTGNKAYSIFQQGAGLVAAWGAVYSKVEGCANAGLDIDRDLAGIEHYAGPASQDADGRYYLISSEGSGYSWDGTYASGSGYPWSSGYPWANGYPWTNGYAWASGFPWSNGYPWANSAVPTGGGPDSTTTTDEGARVAPSEPISFPVSIGTGITVVQPVVQQ